MNGSAPLQNGKDKAAVRQPPASFASSSSQHNGASSDLASTTYLGHDREEITRLLIQALSDLGYSEAADSVMRRSGYALESQAVTEFRQAILTGHWAGAEHLLGNATIATVIPSSGSGDVSEPAAPSSSTESFAMVPTSQAIAAPSAAANGPSAANGNNASLVLIPGTDRDLMRFYIRQQKYLEYLEQGETAKALMVLRNELTPLYRDTQKLHFLSSLLMCPSPDDLKEKATWDGIYGQSRQILLSSLSRLISPSVMLPEHRLAVLLEQVKDFQVAGCVYHTSATSPSLYVDHFCDKSNFPTQVLQELDSQSGEVWQIRFSHDGTRLASCGSGRYVVIWDVPGFSSPTKLDGHSEGVGDFAWSPDDSTLLSCGRDRRARLWDTRTGLLVRLFEQFEEPISCCAWANDGLSVVLGSFDKTRALCQWSLSGERMYTWTKKSRTEDLALSPDGQWLVSMDCEKHIHVYNFVTRELEYEMELGSRAVSIAISQDSGYLLVNRQDGEMQLYNIRSRGNPVRKYIGATGGDYVIRCGFGGADESFVVSGSEGKSPAPLFAIPTGWPNHQMAT